MYGGIRDTILTSITERFREIVLRKSIGSTNDQIRQPILMEAVLLYNSGGLIGLCVGFGFLNLVVFIVSKFNPSISFGRLFDGSSCLISFLSIGVVGILSTLAPAIRAQKLQILESLGSD